MAIITRRISNNLNYTFTMPAPGDNSNQNANLIIPASVVDLDLLTLCTEDTLWTIQPLLLSLQRNGDITVTGTIDTATFDYDGVSTINVSTNPPLNGSVELIPGANIALSQIGQNITISATGELSQTLANSHIFVGNASNVATDVPMSADATISNTGALTLANTAVSAGSYTYTALTVDSKGRITAASSGTAPTSYTFSTGLTNTLGTITLTSPVAVSLGGTGQTSALTQYGVITAASTTAMTSTAAGTANYPLVANSGSAPTFQQLSLTTGVTGILPIANQTLAPIALTEAAGAATVDWSTSDMFTLTLNASCVLAFSNATAGQTIVIRLTNTASNYTVTWPLAIKWPLQTPPVMTVGAFSDVYTIVYDGSNYYGSYVQNF
jgi:hypothetical protein